MEGLLTMGCAVMGMIGTERELQGEELWRRQCARNLMDCYALGMEAAGSVRTEECRKSLEALVGLMVDGMTSVRSSEDELSLYKTAARLCRDCGGSAELGQKAGMFRIYAAVFEDMGRGREEP